MFIEKLFGLISGHKTLAERQSTPTAGLRIKEIEGALGVGPNDVAELHGRWTRGKEARIETPKERARRTQKVDRMLSKVSPSPREIRHPRS